MQRENHEQSPLAVPFSRPQFLSLSPKLLCDRADRPCDGLVHNHPSGDPTPSQADIQLTTANVDIATPLGISVHDHIIVGKNGHASLKGMKLI